MASLVSTIPPIIRSNPDALATSIINQNAHNDKGQRSFKPDTMVTDIKGRYFFARTRSSPELTDTYGEVSSQGGFNKVPESGKSQISSSKLDSNSRRKNLESDVSASQDIRSSTDDPVSVRHSASHHSVDASPDSNSVLNSYSDDLALGAMDKEFSSVARAQGMQQEEQDLVNMMASSMAHSFSGQVHVPLNSASGHITLPLPPSVLASMGYSHRNVGGMVPTNLPFIESASGSNMQFPHTLVSSPLTHYFPGIGLTSSPEGLLEPGNENFGPVETNPGEGDHVYWHEQDRGSSGGFDLDNGNFERLQSDDKQQSTSAGYNLVPSSQTGGSGSARRAPHKFTKEARCSMREDHADSFHYLDNRANEVHFDDRSTSSRSMPASHASSVRSKTNSESSWEGSSGKVSKPAKEKRSRKTAPTAMVSTVYGKGKSVSEYSSVQVDDDDREWNLLPPVGTEMPDRSIGPQSLAPLHIPGHQMTGSEEAQTSGSDSMIPISPVLVDPGSRQKSADNSGVVPLAFYPTGPPVPFFTMLPVYNFPTEMGTSDASTSNFSGDEGQENSDSGQTFNLSEGQHKSDILNSDFHSHWQNLQYGRFCQNPQLSQRLIYTSPMMVPPAYLQGHFPWDGPGRPLSSDMNLFTQLVGYGPRLVHVTPPQSASNRPSGVYQRYIDEMPRYRGGTGTYLPNPKVSARDRHSTNIRRGNYSHDRSDYHGEREGNWNANSKSRASGRTHNRNQGEKSSSRPDWLPASESRADRHWGSQRHDSFPPYHSQNGPFRSNSSQSGSANMSYGMYPLSAMNPSGVSSNGHAIPPVVMMYPYDHNAAHTSPTEQLEFGSLGPVDFSGVNEVSQLSEGSRSSGTFEEQSYHGKARQASPHQPSPQVQRGL